jgi:hypothetical protein
MNVSRYPFIRNQIGAASMTFEKVATSMSLAPSVVFCCSNLILNAVRYFQKIRTLLFFLRTCNNVRVIVLSWQEISRMATTTHMIFGLQHTPTTPPPNTPCQGEAPSRVSVLYFWRKTTYMYASIDVQKIYSSLCSFVGKRAKLGSFAGASPDMGLLGRGRRRQPHEATFCSLALRISRYLVRVPWSRSLPVPVPPRCHASRRHASRVPSGGAMCRSGRRRPHPAHLRSSVGLANYRWFPLVRFGC